ncbi:MAG: hypothetical protein BWZ03_00412 [bacterium ADurb.BinA186]|nr:MAG: hypothetical protein BWZ03_00412 [bacterium ADurb.BinA186]
MGSIRDYVENPNASYRYMFLRDDITAKESNGLLDPILDHGSMFNGILNHRIYRIAVDGVVLPEDQSIEYVLNAIFSDEEE